VLDSVATIIIGGEEDAGFAVIKEYDPSLPDVYGDDGPITQVFLNLVKNARESLAPEDGEIRIITRMTTDFHLVEEASGMAHAEGKRRGMLASIEVRDNGCGIGTDDLEKIFTPFFTTKTGGSGLGMPITLKIIKEHGGLLRIDSKPGKGTSVRVFLPVAQARPTGRTKPREKE
jgi:two-component system nitrogen regulation sensor histidine kinase GlnL